MTKQEQYQLTWMAGFRAAANERPAASELPEPGVPTTSAYARGYQEGQRVLANAVEKSGLEARCFAAKEAS